MRGGPAPSQTLGSEVRQLPELQRSGRFAGLSVVGGSLVVDHPFHGRAQVPHGFSIVSKAGMRLGGDVGRQARNAEGFSRSASLEWVHLERTSTQRPNIGR